MPYVCRGALLTQHNRGARRAIPDPTDACLFVGVDATNNEDNVAGSVEAGVGVRYGYRRGSGTEFIMQAR